MIECAQVHLTLIRTCKHGNEDHDDVQITAALLSSATRSLYTFPDKSIVS